MGSVVRVRVWARVRIRARVRAEARVGARFGARAGVRVSVTMYSLSCLSVRSIGQRSSCAIEG